MKKIMFYCIILYSLFTVNTILRAETEDSVVIQRYALIVGCNYGGTDLTPLKYAVKDAKAISAIFTEIGGVREENKICLYNPSSILLKQSFLHLKNIIQQAKRKAQRTEVLFYYSGHADGDSKSILLNEEKYKFTELTNDIKNLSCDVHIAIIDSCASGVLIRSKGGKIISPFIIDTAHNQEGYAFITSCTDKEQSYESDKIESSFFTYALKAGLRGAADQDGNGNVTLNEVYDYAYNETIKQTQLEATDPQHPSYSIDMVGTGNIILTDIRENTSRIIVSKPVTGIIFIYDYLGNLILEFNKQNKKKTEICLSAGQYTIHVNKDGDIYTTIIKLPFRETVFISSLNGMTKRKKTEDGRKGMTAESSYLSIYLFSGPSLPVWETNSYLTIGIMSLIGFDFNVKYDATTIRFGFLSGINYTNSSKEIVSNYSITTYSFMVSIALSYNILLLNLDIGIAAGFSLNSQYITTTHRSLFAGKPVSILSLGISFHLTDRFLLGVYSKITIIIFDDFNYYAYNPGLFINYNFVNRKKTN